MTFPVSKKTGTNTHGDWPKRIADFKAISNKSPAVLVNAQALCYNLHMRTGILYKLSFPNGKAYIGITLETLAQRVRRHISYARAGRMFALSCAIRKYGEDAFMAEVLRTAESSDLNRIEIETISEYRSRGIILYNMTDGGDGSLGVTPSQKTKDKISASLRGRKCSDQHRLRVSEAQKFKTIPAEVREKMRSAALARCVYPMSEEQRQKRRNALAGKKQSPELIAKRVAARKAKGSY